MTDIPKEREEKGRKKGYRWVGVGSWMSRDIDDRCIYTASSETLHVHKLERYKHTAYKVVSHLQLIMIMPYTFLKIFKDVSMASTLSLCFLHYC